MFKILFLFRHRRSHHRADMTGCHLFNMAIWLLMCAYAAHAHARTCDLPVLLPVM
jgi:hypothetical protein